MRKGFFTGRGRRKNLKTEPRSNSDENLSRYAWSTDPSDLPDGYNVGSMSVPYSPPSPKSPKEEHGLASSKKNKKGLQKSHQIIHQSSPLAAHYYKVKEEVPQETLKQVKSSPIIVKKKISDWAMKECMQRSCSVDALNEIDDEDDEGEETVINEKDKMIRRCSTEVEVAHEGFRKPQGANYSRWVSHQPKSKSKELEKFHRRPHSSFHGDGHFEAKSLAPTQEHQNIPSVILQRVLHQPKSVEQLLEAVQSRDVVVNQLDAITGEAPIHSIVRRKKKDHIELLLALLINSDVEVDLESRKKKTALHVALEVGCEACAKILIVFGADINKQDSNQFTPVDLVINNGRLSAIETILLNLGARSGTQRMVESRKKVPRLFSFAEKLRPPKRGERLSTNDNLSEFVKRRGTNKLYRELEINVNRRMSLSVTIGGADDAFALVLQQRELALYNRTLKKPIRSTTKHGLRGGSRILFLDGGGIKGLVQLEVLIQLEERTQCSISDLFDWIVGTSTGGIIALAVVYAKKSLCSLRQLYFLLKNRIFMKSRYGFGYNSEALEDILRDYLDPDIKMSDVTHPKVLIAAVNKATTNLELHFFNNCFGDDYVDYPIWKVARYTSAAPMFFNEYENYVDGGVICNNPTDCGLTAIQNFCRLQGYRLSIAMVVSIGTGVYPAEKIGSVDAQDALFFGKQWLKPSKLIKQTQNLLSLLTNAVSS